jgi:hypothetical protein
VILQPGTVFEDEVSLGKWFRLTEIGVYDLHGSYFPAFVKPERVAFETLREDHVGADFTITIR